MARELAPNPGFPERTGTTYETKVAYNTPRRGPLRFEEGVATDTDIPNNFTTGVLQGLQPAPGRPNHNQSVYIKGADETIQERAHMGSAAWVEAPTFLGEFAHGSNADLAAQRYEQVTRSGQHYTRINPANVPD